MPKVDDRRANSIGMRISTFFSGRPVSSKYSVLPFWS